MTFYAIHDEPGRIIQGNKVFSPTIGYEDQLRALGQKFVKREGTMVLRPDDWFVSGGDLVKRQIMPVVATKTHIRAGGSDSAVLVGVPRGATATITTGGVAVFQGAIDATELEIGIPVPCVYRVALDLWPFRTFTVDIEAAA